MVADVPFLGVTRSFAGYVWRARLTDDRLGFALAQRLDLPELLGRVLAARGVDPESAPHYLNPRLRDLLPDPAHLRDMEEGAARLAGAVMAGETIGIFGDYDVDGATSAALLIRFFRAVGARTLVHVPDRLAEGYGPNAPALLSLAARGARVVVTVDCGTMAHEPLAAAAAGGVEVIVVDHHIAEPALPRALAVINPNRVDETSPHGQLAAVGVAFLLVVAVNRALRNAGWYGAGREAPDLTQWLDLVALGTVCDVVPLTGVNRVLVIQGLKVLAARRNPGLGALADVAKVEARPGVYHAGFLLGPRINAGGRVGRADLGTRLLATDDPDEARTIALELDRLNRERQAIEALVEEAARAQVEAEGQASEPAIVVAGHGWHPGVVGIVAARLAERYRVPALVLARAGDVARGSGRSRRGVDLGAAVTAARQVGLLQAGGGHPMAAGFTLAAAGIEAFAAFLRARLGPAVAAAGDRATLSLDGALAVGGATAELVESLALAGPYGAGNPEPRFALIGARLVKVDRVGSDHVRCVLADEGGARLKAIAFRQGETALGAGLLGAAGRRLHVAGRLRVDAWRGDGAAEIHIDDAAPAAA